MASQITPLPAPPARTDPVNFSARADAFLQALPLFQGEANAVALGAEASASLAGSKAIEASQQVTLASQQVSLAANQVTLASGQVTLAAAEAVKAQGQVALAGQQVFFAQEARDIAAASANYKGEYSAATTYQIGQSVSYLGKVFAAKTVNTGVTPVSGNEWLEVYTTPLRYRQFLNQATNINLTELDDGSVIVVEGTSNLTLTLPNATTLRFRSFQIKNASNFFKLAVYDNTGRLLFNLLPFTGSSLYAYDATTSAGKWVSQEPHYGDFAASSSIFDSINAFFTTSPDSIASLSSTQAVLVFAEENSVFTVSYFAVVVTNNAGNLSFGNRALFHQSPASSTLSSIHVSVEALSATSVLVATGRTATPLDNRLIALSISGTTISVGEPVVVPFAGSNTQGQISITALSSTVALIVAGASSGVGGAAVVATVSGLNTTLGVTSTGTDIHGGFPMVSTSGLTATSALLVVNNTTNLQARVLTITGTGAAATITAGALQNIATGNFSLSVSVVAISSTTAVVTASTTTAVSYLFVTVSGTTVTANSTGQISVSNAVADLALTSATNGAIIYTDPTAAVGKIVGFSISGTTLTLGATVASTTIDIGTPSLISFQAPSVASPSATSTMIAAYKPAAQSVYLAQAFSITGNSVTVNASKLVQETSSSLAAENQSFLCALSTSRAIMLSGSISDSGAATFKVRLLNVSGSSSVSIAVGQAVATGIPSNFAITALTSTLAVAVWTEAGTTTVRAAAINVTGDSISIGTQVTVGSPSTPTPSIDRLSSSAAIASDGTNTRVLTVSGTTITLGANAAITGKVASLSSTSFIVRSATTLTLASVSGTTVSSLSFFPLGSRNQVASAVALSPTRIFLCSSGSLGSSVLLSIIKFQIFDIVNNTFVSRQARVFSDKQGQYQINDIAAVSVSSGEVYITYKLTAATATEILMIQKIGIFGNGDLDIGDPTPFYGKENEFTTPIVGSIAATAIETPAVPPLATSRILLSFPESIRFLGSKAAEAFTAHILTVQTGAIK